MVAASPALAMVLAITALTSACRSPGGPCETWRDCLESEICLESFCRLPCTSNGDCDAQQECFMGGCVPERAGADRGSPDRVVADLGTGDLLASDSAPADNRLVDTSPRERSPDAAPPDRAVNVDGGDGDLAVRDRAPGDRRSDASVDGGSTDQGTLDAPLDAASDRHAPDPCSNLDCPVNEVCQILADQIPFCTCSTQRCSDGHCLAEGECCDSDDCGQGDWRCRGHSCSCQERECDDDYCPSEEACCEDPDCGGGFFFCLEDHSCLCPTDICDDGHCRQPDECCVTALQQSQASMEVGATTPEMSGHGEDLWDLTACALQIRFTYDGSGLNDDLGWDGQEGSHAWAEIGVRNDGYPDINPTFGVEGAGVWFYADYQATAGTFDPDPDEDLDDHLLLQKAGGVVEEGYDLPGVPPIPGDSHRCWFDRDGVNSSQALNPLAVNGGTYNTDGRYDIVIDLAAVNDFSGTAYMTVNGLQQGFETNSDWSTMEMAPAGMTFSADMKELRLFYGFIGEGELSHSVEFEDIEVTGCRVGCR